MAVSLNLLPPELTVGKNLKKTLSTIRVFTVITVAAFLVFIVGAVGYFIFSTVKYRSLVSQNAALQNQILSFESSEQQIVLVKDRIKKINTIQALPESSKNLKNIEPFLSVLSADTAINELEVNSKAANFTLGFKSSSELSAFVKSVSETKIFKQVVISAFGYSPLTGYTVSFDLLNK